MTELPPAKLSPRARLMKFAVKHRLFCVTLLVLLIVCAVLGALKPSQAELSARLSPQYAQGNAAANIAKPVDINLGVVGAARGRNVKTAETETYIGFAGRIFSADEGALEVVGDIIVWLPQLIKGAEITVLLTTTSVIAGLVGALFLALGRISKLKLLNKLCGAYIFFFRGTPLMLQLLVIYFGLPRISPVLTFRDPFRAAFVAFALNTAAYCAEVIRAAIQSIDKGQFEAGHALGFSGGQTMRLIIIPQSFRRLIPPVANEYIMVLKDCALVTVIALNDLTTTATQLSNSNASILPYLPALGIYLVITAFFTFIFNRMEKRFSIHL